MVKKKPKKRARKRISRFVKSLDEIDDKLKDKIVKEQLKNIEAIENGAKDLVKSIDEIDDKVKDKIVKEHLQNLEKIRTNARAHARKFEKEARKTTATAIAAAKRLGAEKGNMIAYSTSYDKSPGDSFVGYVGIVF